MIVILGAIIGAIIGGSLAKKRGGKPLDILQYAGIFALMFAIGGLFVTLFAHRIAL